MGIGAVDPRSLAPLRRKDVTLALIEFLIDKTGLLDRLGAHMNPRQKKALLRMLQEGPEGFQGGMSAGKYSAITCASPATATRDLADLTEKGGLIREGERRHARYELSVPLRPMAHVTINERGEIVPTVPGFFIFELLRSPIAPMRV